MKKEITIKEIKQILDDYLSSIDTIAQVNQWSMVFHIKRKSQTLNKVVSTRTAFMVVDAYMKGLKR